MYNFPDSARLAGWVAGSAGNLTGYARLFLDTAGEAARLKNSAVRDVFYRQVYFTGIKALGIVAVWGFLLGMVVITQESALVGRNPALTGKILVWTVVRELGPLFTAIILISRSSTAVAAEIGSMKVNRELAYLKAMGISPIGYLVLPRVVAMTLCAFALTFYLQFVAIAGGLAVSSLVMGIPLMPHLNGVISALDFTDVSLSLLKGVVFGMAISVVSSYYGLRARHSITEVPQKTMAAVTRSLLIVLVCDAALALASKL